MKRSGRYGARGAAAGLVLHTGHYRSCTDSRNKELCWRSPFGLGHALYGPIRKEVTSRPAGLRCFQPERFGSSRRAAERAEGVGLFSEDGGPDGSGRTRPIPTPRHPLSSYYHCPLRPLRLCVRKFWVKTFGYRARPLAGD